MWEKGSKRRKKRGHFLPSEPLSVSMLHLRRRGRRLLPALPLVDGVRIQIIIAIQSGSSD